MYLVNYLIILINCYHLIFGQTFKSFDDENQSPVIGILAMPNEDTGNQTSPSNIPASYVKFIESAGGQVIPIMLGKDEEYYSKMINLTSGILFTGGSINLFQSIYTESAFLIWKLALKENDAGHYYPLWGTCQGFEFFLYAALEMAEWPFVKCKAQDLVQPLNFIPDWKNLKETKIFHSAPDQIIKILASERVTYNAHDWCLPVDGQAFLLIEKFFKNLAKSFDSDGLEFVSMIESVNYPIYGVQFHPEKPAFEPVIAPDRINTPHTFNSILVGQFFANFFISEAKKSDHRYPFHNDQARAQLIYNYCPEYTALNASYTNEQIYYFN